MSPGACIDYKTLLQIYPETARKAVVEYLKTNAGNKAGAARVFSIYRLCHQLTFEENVDLAPGIVTHHDHCLAHGIIGTSSLDLVDYILALQGQIFIQDTLLTRQDESQWVTIGIQCGDYHIQSIGFDHRLILDRMPLSRFGRC